MRSIKFKAWDYKLKKMWDSVGFRDNDCGRFILPELGMISSNDDEMTYGIPQHEPTGEKRIELFQFTGLFDKNGKEIWEGDIVKWLIFPEGDPESYVTDFVSFSGGSFKVEKRCELLGLKEPHRQLEVIGNIFEDGDLLNDSKNSKTE